MRIVDFIAQIFSFIEAQVGCASRFAWFFQGDADSPVKAGDVTPDSSDMFSGVGNLRQLLREEFADFQFFHTFE